MFHEILRYNNAIVEKKCYCFRQRNDFLEVTALLRISRSTTLWRRYAPRRLQPFFQITFLIYARTRPPYPRALAFPIYMQMPPHERCNWT